MVAKKKDIVCLVAQLALLGAMTTIPIASASSTSESTSKAEILKRKLDQSIESGRSCRKTKDCVAIEERARCNILGVNRASEANIRKLLGMYEEALNSPVASECLNNFDSTLVCEKKICAFMKKIPSQRNDQ